MWNDFDAVDFRIFDVGRERDVQFSVGHIRVHGFDVGALRTPGFHPNIKIFEFVSADAKGKNAFTGAGDAVESFAEMQFYGVFAIGNIAGKIRHAIMFGAIKRLVNGVGNLHVTVAFNGVAVRKSLVWKPHFAFGICIRIG